MIINDQKIYNGDFIHKRFAYKYFRKNVLPSGNIVSYVAPALVDINLIDLEDSLSQDFIFSDKMIHFCWEIPNMNAFGAVAFQRLFCTNVGMLLKDTINKPVQMKGDDIMVHDEFIGGNIIQQKGKASVSITYAKEGIAIGHLGINIEAGPKAPPFAYSTKMDAKTAESFQHAVMETFYGMTDDIFVATTKVIV